MSNKTLVRRQSLAKFGSDSESKTIVLRGKWVPAESAASRDEWIPVETAIWQREGEERLAAYRAWKARRAFRSSSEWRKLKKRILAERPACESCGAPSSIVDHIHAIADGGTALDPSNLQALCPGCHEEKGREENRRRPAKHSSVRA
jgi:5-methylcytosine-specific restriction enzyme A